MARRRGERERERGEARHGEVAMLCMAKAATQSRRGKPAALARRAATLRGQCGSRAPRQAATSCREERRDPGREGHQGRRQWRGKIGLAPALGSSSKGARWSAHVCWSWFGRSCEGKWEVGPLHHVTGKVKKVFNVKPRCDVLFVLMGSSL